MGGRAGRPRLGFSQTLPWCGDLGTRSLGEEGKRRRGQQGRSVASAASSRSGNSWDPNYGFSGWGKSRVGVAAPDAISSFVAPSSFSSPPPPELQMLGPFWSSSYRHSHWVYPLAPDVQPQPINLIEWSSGTQWYTAAGPQLNALLESWLSQGGSTKRLPGTIILPRAG